MTTEMQECRKTCWIIAAVVGVVFWLLLMIFGSWGFFSALIIGVIVALIAGFGLIYFRCASVEQGTSAGPVAGGSGTMPVAGNVEPDAADADAPAGTATADAAGATAAGSASTDDAEEVDVVTPSELAEEVDGDKSVPTGGSAPATAFEAPKPAKVNPSKPLAGQEELSRRKGDWKYGSEKSEGAAAPASAAADAPSASSAGAAAESQPETLDAPRGTADDLKRISGVGPKLEQTLNDLGIYHFFQIASWGAEEIAWVDSRLKFKGRIERDNWIAQAKAFAEGQEL